jgi:hypothetical protein
MPRAVKKWIGKDDNTPVPPRVRDRVLTAKGEKCHACGRQIRTGEKWTCEHLIALINWRATAEAPHGNRESNLDVTCCNCLAPKNAADVAEKSIVYSKRLKARGIKPHQWRPMAGTRASGLRKRMNGQVERW